MPSVDQIVFALVSAGPCWIAQYVPLASELDARSYRLDCLASSVVFELDPPKVLEYKVTTLAAHGLVPSATLRAVAVDLRTLDP
jgi:O-methyltransferase involved in polyketide biosynthesis